MSTPLEDYALLGDRRTAALVGRDGSIDWWCVPRFDSGACFAALLGNREHGRFLLAPVGAGEIERHYRPQSLVLETEHDDPTGTVRITDCLATVHARRAWSGSSRASRGRTTMQFELVMRFDYGAIVPWVRRRQDGLTTIAGPDGLRLRTPSRSAARTCARSRRSRSARGPRAVRARVVSVAPPPDATPSAPRCSSDTDDEWRAWSAQCVFQRSAP